MNEPPYLRIAADIRRRVTAGVLRPGQRVPSVRSLARKWNVALATATKAVTTLAHEGVIRTEPRRGAVIAEPRAPKVVKVDTVPEPLLSRERIVAAAIDMADAEGFPALSVRGVAAKLAVPAMSLYRHVRNKDELVQLMTEAALGEERLPLDPPPHWRAQVELGARLQWRIFRRHPWLSRVMSVTRPRPLPNALAHAEWMLRALDGLGLAAATMLQLHVALHGFIQGLAVNLDVEAQEAVDSGVTEAEWMAANDAAFAALARSAPLPTFGKVLGELAEGFDLELDAVFELGLGVMLDGLAAAFQARMRGRDNRRGARR